MVVFLFAKAFAAKIDSEGSFLRKQGKEAYSGTLPYQSFNVFAAILPWGV